MDKDKTNTNQITDEMPPEEDFTAGQFFIWEAELFEKYSLEELEANPALLTMIPEERRADYLKEQRLFQEEVRKLREKMAEMTASLKAYRETYPDHDEEWNRVQAAAIKRYGLTEEEFNNIIIQAPEANSMTFGDFVAQSSTTDGELLIGGLLDSILRKAEKEKRPINEVITETIDAIENSGDALFMPIPYDKALSALTYMTQKNTEIVEGGAVYKKPKLRITIANFEKTKSSLGIGTDKLLSTTLAAFAKNNHFGKNETTAKNLEVVIPLKEYALLNNYDVEEHETSTPEEAEAEKKRAKAQLDNARKKIKKHQQILYNISIDWDGKTVIKDGKETKEGAYKRRRIFTGVDYEDGCFKFLFAQDMANALVRGNVFSQYNINLLKIDERKPNAYRIMRMLDTHYNMISNQRGGTHNRLKIENVLKVTDLPSFQKVQATARGHWMDRIKEPLESNLDYLTQAGLLKSWKYTHEKGKDLSDEEAQGITQYEEFSKLYLEFEPVSTIDHQKRIETKTQEALKKNAAILKEEAKLEARNKHKKNKR